jgi:hypothetical protein
MKYEIGENGKATVWTFRTQPIVAVDESEARLLLTAQALRDVPEASVKIMSIRQTPTGRYSAIIKRDRTVGS